MQSSVGRGGSIRPSSIRPTGGERVARDAGLAERLSSMDISNEKEFMAWLSLYKSSGSSTVRQVGAQRISEAMGALYGQPNCYMKCPQHFY